jgi:hypothetical protein
MSARRIVRTIALSGVAAAAVLGTATTSSAATPETVHTVVEAAVDRAAGAPVTLPSGTRIHVTGMESAAYRATDVHRTAVVQLAAATPAPKPPKGGTKGIEDSLDDFEGANNEVGGQQPQGGIGQQIPQQPAGYGMQQPQQMQTQAGAGTGLGVGAVVILVLSIVLVFGLKGGKVSKGWAIACIVLGVALGGTVVGGIVSQISGSGVSAVNNIFGSLG